MTEKRLQVLNRDAIKYIAMLTMLLNHIAHIFLERGTPLYEIFQDIGFFTAPVMCFFLVEGYTYTRSKKEYGLRLLLFAVLSQIPFQLAFGYSTLNMIYTLFCCFLILVVAEKVRNPFLCRGLLLLLILAAMGGDWPVVAPFLTICLRAEWGDRRKMAVSYGMAYLLFAALNAQSYVNGKCALYVFTHALLSSLGILAAAVATLVLYNGERAKHGKNFSKWFFYLFYPGHLLILYLIKSSLHNM